MKYLFTNWFSLTPYLVVLLIMFYSCHKWEGPASQQSSVAEYISVQFYTSDSTKKSGMVIHESVWCGFRYGKEICFQLPSRSDRMPGK